MSSVDDPRVLFAAERTLMAWSRTAGGLMAFGFVIERTALLTRGAAAGPGVALWIGLAFVLLGVALCVLSIVQYRRSVADLRPVEIPPGYWVNLSVYAAALIAVLGIALALYLAAGSA
jgi:putative membrane protein